MDQTKAVLDTALASGAVTAPVWIGYVQTGIGLLMGVGGVILLALRIGIAWREWRAKKASG